MAFCNEKFINLKFPYNSAIPLFLIPRFTNSLVGETFDGLHDNIILYSGMFPLSKVIKEKATAQCTRTETRTNYSYIWRGSQ